MKVYPKRTDGLTAIRFFDNAYEIAGAVRQEVCVVHDLKGGERLMLQGAAVPRGSWVLLNNDREVVEVLDDWEFEKQYSENGL